VGRCPLKRSGLGGLGVALLRSVSVNLAELRRVLMCEGLNVALLRSVSVNLAELRRAQTSWRAVVGKEFANKSIKI
jgi:hypothetical protein